MSIAVFNPEFLHVYAIMRKLADPLARYYFTMPDEEGYMAGVVAGLKSTIGSMLIFSGNADPYGKLYVNAFKNGVYSVCPSCTVQLAYFGSLSDSISVGSYAPSVYYNISKFDVFFNAVPGLLGEAAMIWSGNQNISVIGSTFNIDHNSYSNFTAANLR